MNTHIHSHKMKTSFQALVPAVVLILFAIPYAHAGSLASFTPGEGESFTSNVTLMDSTTRNGSFESGTSGWTPVTSSIAAVSSPTPTDGSNALQISGTGTPTIANRTDNYSMRSMGLDYSNGDVFRISFDVYVPSTGGYSWLAITPLTMNGGSATSVGNLVTATLTNDTWVSQDMYWQLDADDGLDGLDMRIDFRRFSGATGTYEGFIDNVVITQGSVSAIPEPSTLALMALFFFALVFQVRRKI